VACINAYGIWVRKPEFTSRLSVYGKIILNRRHKEDEDYWLEGEGRG
jgi:hypothetical protein